MTNDSFILYATRWCGYCIRLKWKLKRAGINYTEVNITQNHAAAALVERLNGGNQTVPTVVFADGRALTNPSLRDIQQRLAAEGRQASE